jgi:hypothetical protein
MVEIRGDKLVFDAPFDHPADLAEPVLDGREA